MNTRIISLISALLFSFTMVVFASAVTEDYIIDTEDILTASEIGELDKYGQKIEDEYNVAVLFCITSDTKGASTTEFCEESYDSFTTTPDGILITHDISKKNYSWYCAGNAEKVFTEAVVQNLMQLYSDDASYFGGIKDVYTTAENILKTAPALTSATQTTKVEQTTKKAETTQEATTEFKRVERTLPLVVDNADLLTDEEEKSLLARCEAFTAEHEMEIAILTVNDFDGKTYEEYGDDFYDYNGYGYGEDDDGILVLYKPGEEGERALYITTHGKGEMEFFDTIREEIFSAMKGLLLEGDYEGAFNIYLDKAEEIMKPGVSIIWLFVLPLIGVTVGLLVVTVMISGNKSVIRQSAAKEYVRQGSVVVTGSSDNFRYTHTDAIPKATDNDSNGSSSSTHTSSSGRTHAGTGGTF